MTTYQKADYPSTRPGESPKFLAFTTPGSYANYSPNGSDLGSGGGQTTWAFQTAEGRDIWISKAVEINALTRRVNLAENELAYLRTSRGANENLRAARAKRREGRRKPQ